MKSTHIKSKHQVKTLEKSQNSYDFQLSQYTHNTLVGCSIEQHELSCNVQIEVRKWDSKSDSETKSKVIDSQHSTSQHRLWYLTNYRTKIAIRFQLQIAEARVLISVTNIQLGFVKDWLRCSPRSRQTSIMSSYIFNYRINKFEMFRSHHRGLQLECWGTFMSFNCKLGLLKTANYELNEISSSIHKWCIKIGTKNLDLVLWYGIKSPKREEILERKCPIGFKGRALDIQYQKWSKAS